VHLHTFACDCKVEHSWKPFCESLFSSYVAFLTISGASQKRCLFLVKGTGKNQLEPGQERMGDAQMLSHCRLLRKPGQKNRLHATTTPN
jgi:hypothetical protein